MNCFFNVEILYYFWAFLPSSIRETTYFSSLSLYLPLNALIIPPSNSCNREVVPFGKRISLMFFEIFWSVSGWQCALSWKRMILLLSSWNLQTRSLSTSSIISVLIQAFSFEKYCTVLGLVLPWMFLKHLGDLLFQVTIFEPSAATKKAAVRRCLDFLPLLHLLDFPARPFSGKALKNKPRSSMFQVFLNS